MPRLPVRVALLALLALPASAQFQSVRQPGGTTPPNPAAFGVDLFGGPRVGATWNPTVSNAPGLFTPPLGTPSFFVGVSSLPSAPEIFLGLQAGTLLCSVLPPNPLLLLGPVTASTSPTPFPITIPADCAFVGKFFCTQAIVLDAATGVRFCNGIDIIVGNGPAGLYSVCSDDDLLRTLDPTTGQTMSSIAMFSTSGTVLKGNGLARNPTTNELFAVLQMSGVRSTGASSAPKGAPKTVERRRGKGKGTGGGGGRGSGGVRYLATVCPLTGEAVLIGSLRQAFAGIAFDGSGNLWGVTGDGAQDPEKLYLISAFDATTVFLTALGNGDDGEMLGYNPNDGLLYHGSGGYPTPATAAFETIDPINPFAPPVNVPLSSPLHDDELNALSEYDVAAGGFWWGSGCCTGDSLYLATATGTGTLVGNLDHTPKGLATVQ